MSMALGKEPFSNQSGHVGFLAPPVRESVFPQPLITHTPQAFSEGCGDDSLMGGECGDQEVQLLPLKHISAPTDGSAPHKQFVVWERKFQSLVYSSRVEGNL